MTRPKSIPNIFYVLCFLLAVSFLAAQARAQDNYDPKAIKFFEKGFEAMKKEKYEEAIKQFTKAIEVDPKFDKAYYDRALCNVRMNKFDESLPDYNKAIEVNPNYTVALVGRGRLLHYKKMIKEALADYNKAIELGTDDPVAYYNRGVIYQKGLIEDYGMKDFLKAIELNPKYYEAYYNIACIYAVKNNEEKAIFYLELAVNTGMKELEFMMKDPDLDNIRNSEGFKKIIEKLKAK